LFSQFNWTYAWSKPPLYGRKLPEYVIKQSACAICISYISLISWPNDNHDQIHAFTYLVEYRLLKRSHHKLQAQHPAAQNEAILLALSWIRSLWVFSGHGVSLDKFLIRVFRPVDVWKSFCNIWSDRHVKLGMHWEEANIWWFIIIQSYIKHQQ